MKKLLAFSISLAIISIAFTGCGKTETPDNTALTSSENTQSQDVSSEASSKVSDANAYVPGVWEDNIYKSKQLNMTFELPKTWVKASDEELMNIMQVRLDSMVNKTEAEKELAKKQSIFDFLLSDPANQSGVQLISENLSTALGGSQIDEEKYASIVQQQFPKSENVTYVTGKTTKVTLAAQEYLLLPITIKEQAGFHLDYMIKKNGDYMTTLIASYMDKDAETYKNFLDSIKPLA